MSDNNISRKDALKKIGGLALSSSMLSPFIGSHSKKEQGFPNIITNRSSSKPNILWITGEGVPLKVLSCYGSNLIDTPNIDRIANEGMLFNNSFCTNALCAPSRATLLTGKYSHKNGMLANPYFPDLNHFAEEQQTFPKIMRENGYQTGMVGKWHLKANPAHTGFDYFSYKRGAGGPYYNPNGYMENPSLGSDKIVKRKRKGYLTDNFTDLAIQGIEKFDRPFMMMVQYFNAHRPFDPPHKYEDDYNDIRIPEPGTMWDDYSMRSAAAEEARMRISDMKDFDPPKHYTERQLKQWNYQQLMGHFLGDMKSQDENIGRLLNYLDEKGLAENTIVVYTSDHGFFLGEHGWFDKRFMYEEAIRVPWMIRYPGQIEAGQTSDDWVVNIDNAPTALDMVDLPVPDDMQGRSLKPLVQGNTPEDWRDSLYYHYYEFGGPHWVLPHYGIRTDRYKLIDYYTVNEWELFDLERDPDEMENLFIKDGYDVKEGYSSIARKMVDKLKGARKKFDDNTGKPVKFIPTGRYN